MSSKSSSTWYVGLCAIVLILTGCATSGGRVSCTSKLQPINIASPKPIEATAVLRPSAEEAP